MPYSNAIKKLRNKLIMTQTEFAEMWGVSFAAVNIWESGKFNLQHKPRGNLHIYMTKYGIVVED